jgi:adenylate cyclase class IV
MASGYDHFYANYKDGSCFCRHRVGHDLNQLTFKRKLNDKNNYVRTEHNISLTAEVSTDQVAALCDEFGFKYKGSIYKDAFIYKYQDYTFVYYICYDLDMKELGRFMEIELSEDKNWESYERAISVLNGFGNRFNQELDVTPQMRLKKSLYEMFIE